MSYSKLNKIYIELLQLADDCQSRKEAIYLINKAERVRQQMMSVKEGAELV